MFPLNKDGKRGLTIEFQPEYMQMSVLTAALQELTPREKRRKDPDLAVEDWIRFGRDLGVRRLQLSSALPEELADVRRKRCSTRSRTT